MIKTYCAMALVLGLLYNTITVTLQICKIQINHDIMSVFDRTNKLAEKRMQAELSICADYLAPCNLRMLPDNWLRLFVDYPWMAVEYIAEFLFVYILILSIHYFHLFTLLFHSSQHLKLSQNVFGLR